MEPDPLENAPLVRKFLEAIESVRAAYRYQAVTIVSIETASGAAILNAQIRLLVSKPDLLPRVLTTARLSVKQCVLPLLSAEPRQCLQQCLTDGRIPIADFSVRLCTDASRPMSEHYYHGSSDYRRPNDPPFFHRLTIEGSDWSLLGATDDYTNRELQNESYESLEDLMRDFGLPILNRRASLEVVADPVAQFASATLQGRSLEIGISLAAGLPPTGLRVAINSENQLANRFRQTIGGDQIEWSPDSDLMHGVYRTELTQDTVLRCRVLYKDRQDECRVLDPAALPNFRRRIVELADPQLERHFQLLTRPKKDQGEDFEAAVSLLMFMLGCAPAYVSSMSNMQDEPDIYAVSPSGGILVVECTTKVADDTKITKLVARAGTLRQKLRESGADGPPSVTTVLVVPLPPEELLATSMRCDEHGVLLVDRPAIEAAIRFSESSRTMDELLEHWHQVRLLRKFALGDLQR